MSAANNKPFFILLYLIGYNITTILLQDRPTRSQQYPQDAAAHLITVDNIPNNFMSNEAYVLKQQLSIIIDFISKESFRLIKNVFFNKL